MAFKDPEKETEESPAPKQPQEREEEPGRDSQQGPSGAECRGGDATPPRSPAGNANKNARKKSTPPGKRATELVIGQDAGVSPQKKSLQGGSQSSVSARGAGGGWLTAHNALSAKDKRRRGEAGGVRRVGDGSGDGEKGGRREGAEGDIEEEEEEKEKEKEKGVPPSPPEAALTEQRRYC